MTDFHCQRCRRSIRIYLHVRFVVCTSCDRYMVPGRGRGTMYDARLSAVVAELLMEFSDWDGAAMEVLR